MGICRLRTALGVLIAMSTAVPSVAAADESVTDRVELVHDTRLGWVGAATFTGAYLLAALFWTQSDCGEGGCGRTGLVFVPIAGPMLAQREVSARIHEAGAGVAYANVIVLWPFAIMATLVQAGGAAAAVVGFGAKTKKVYVPNEVSVRVDAQPGHLGLSGTW